MTLIHDHDEVRQRQIKHVPTEDGDPVPGSSTLTLPGGATVFRALDRQYSDNRQGGNGIDERIAIPGTADNVIYDYLRNAAIDILLQVVQELAGMGPNAKLATVNRLCVRFGRFLARTTVLKTDRKAKFQAP
ncbi:hypothetical protein [Paraburkholderia aspalathi]|uniref:hypothetical protein n=1 Tax=Paraburkholderia aspalathi TaxID=1324617 RepID=UPI0038BCA800